MTVFFKPGEEPTDGKPVIRLRPPGSDRWADEWERRFFIRSVHFIFHKEGGTLKTIAEALDATVEEVKGALRCDP